MRIGAECKRNRHIQVLGDVLYRLMSSLFGGSRIDLERVYLAQPLQSCLTREASYDSVIRATVRSNQQSLAVMDDPSDVPYRLRDELSSIAVLLNRQAEPRE